MKDERLVRLGTLASNLMERVLLDTDILSEIFKRQDPQIVAHAMRYAATHQQFTFTAVSVHEVIYGLSSKLANRQLQIARHREYRALSSSTNCRSPHRPGKLARSLTEPKTSDR